MSEVENTATETQEEASQGAELNISDLNTLRAIIDLASSRGAFKPTEMIAVGTAYTKLNTFLEKVAAQAEAQAEAQSDAQQEAQ